MKYLFIGILIIALLIGCCPKKSPPVVRRPASPPAIVPKMINGDQIVDYGPIIEPQLDFRKNP